MAVPQQLPQIPIFWTRHPDAREVTFHHQLQYVLGIEAIVPLFAHSLASNLSRIPYP
jgi:hypothetical protein